MWVGGLVGGKRQCPPGNNKRNLIAVGFLFFPPGTDLLDGHPIAAIFSVR